MILPCLYNAPVSWYALFLNEQDTAVIEVHDHYLKQTYRNRCRIMGANGVIDLVIPVVKDHGNKTLLRDVRIDYDPPWQKIHWRSILSAYASAPFYEFMQDEYHLIYHKKFRFLADMNMELIRISLDQLQIESPLKRSDSYRHLDRYMDLREIIHPKRKFEHASIHFDQTPYQQVFADRHGFFKDLSIIDLLFNEGPNAKKLLKESLSKK